MAILNAELEVAAGELGGLEETFNDAKADKDAYDQEEERLKEAKQALDADGTDEEKQAAQ